jgi:hypothetical protein
MEPGLELDKLIAKKVLGWYQDSDIGGPRVGWLDPTSIIRGTELFLSLFSTDIKAAWRLAERFKLCIVPWGNGWTAIRQGMIFVEGERNKAPTAAHAICLAALNIIESGHISEPSVKWDGYGCRITYKDMVLNCVKYPNGEQNYREAINALNSLLGFPVTDEQFRKAGGKAEFFRSFGGD